MVSSVSVWRCIYFSRWTISLSHTRFCRLWDVGWFSRWLISHHDQWASSLGLHSHYLDCRNISHWLPKPLGDAENLQLVEYHQVQHPQWSERRKLDICFCRFRVTLFLLPLASTRRTIEDVNELLCGIVVLVLGIYVLYYQVWSIHFQIEVRSSFVDG